MEALASYDAFVVDLDGVCYVDGVLFDGISEALHELEASGKDLVFVTNNSFRTPETFAAYLTAGPFEADPASIITSSTSAAGLLRRILEDRENPRFEAVVAGGEGLVSAVRGAAVETFAPEDWPAEEPPPGIVVGLDRRLDYRRLSLLATFAREGAAFVATNTDSTYPTPGGLVPGAGSIVAAVEVASGKKAEIAGKPHRPMVELVAEAIGERNALVVGDRPDTDLAFAHNLGVDSALVLTGVGGIDEALASPYPPRFVGRSLPDLLADPVELTRSAEGRLEVVGGRRELVEEIQRIGSSAP